MFQKSSMLERTSRFVLEVLPCLLSALIAVVLVSGFLFSQVPGTKAAAMLNAPRGVENALEIIRWGHAAFASDPHPHVAGQVY
jgi:hypothetical protein